MVSRVLVYLSNKIHKKIFSDLGVKVRYYKYKVKILNSVEDLFFVEYQYSIDISVMFSFHYCLPLAWQRNNNNILGQLTHGHLMQNQAELVVWLPDNWYKYVLNAYIYS